MWPLILSVFLSFALGAIPTGFWLGKLLGRDIREVGSGNTGATNASRALGKKAGILVLVLDAAKGWVPVVFLAPWSFAQGSVGVPELHQALLGFAAVSGHVWSPFLQFKGGKGVATGAGVALALRPVYFLAGFVIFVGFLLLWRRVSIGSLGAALVIPLISVVRADRPEISVCLAAVSALIILRHRANIRRLMHGEEKPLF
ncbi:MAG: glycerol-3-phosphate 1-O-acyltransferase PlsY [Candidatus Omnitrophica bacterium]|nr:glycerol-3-phosphate 1-O-acyltransferase PlsY [Candidatus Omnitrophota bacterium]